MLWGFQWDRRLGLPLRREVSRSPQTEEGLVGTKIRQKSEATGVVERRNVKGKRRVGGVG